MTALAISRCLDADFAKALRTELDADIDLDAPRSPREIMQWWGTQYRRAQNPRYWVDHAVIACCQAIVAGAKTVVLTDVRAPHEVAMLRFISGSLWQIKRPGYASGAGHAGHSSDVDGSTFGPDVIINNAHDIGHLQHLVLSAYAQLRCNTTPSRTVRAAKESEAA